MAITEGTRSIVSGWPPKGVPMTCLEAVSYGDLLGIDTAGKVFPVDSDDAEHGRLVAGAAGAADEVIPCYWCAVITGYTGGTEGAAIYPQGTTPGSVSETADTDGGDSNECVGYVLDQYTIFLMPGVFVDSTV